jgi:hypothetical protein
MRCVKGDHHGNSWGSFFYTLAQIGITFSSAAGRTSGQTVTHWKNAFPTHTKLRPSGYQAPIASNGRGGAEIAGKRSLEPGVQNSVAGPGGLPQGSPNQTCLTFFTFTVRPLPDL